MRASERASRQAFLGVSALLWVTSAALTIAWCASMSAMDAMPMDGSVHALSGHTTGQAEDPEIVVTGSMSASTAASFVAMWIVMMVAMMLPSLVPTLWCYRQAVDRTAGTRAGLLTALAGAGYFFVWTLIGVAAFPLSVAVSALEMQQPAVARAVPTAIGLVVLVAGCLQFTAWKARHLACCRTTSDHGGAPPPDAGAAWRHGLRLGLRCVYCCGSLMAVLLVIGVMDLRAMAVVTVAITAERFAPAGQRVARASASCWWERR